MLKIFLLLAALCVVAAPAPAPAQFTYYQTKTAVVAGYTGPCDVDTCTAGYGLRAVSASAGSGAKNAIKLCTALDALCTIIHVTATGALNAADITTSTCGTCTISTIYDQIGSADLIQTTEASRPTWTASCSGSLPCAAFTTSQFLVRASAPITGYPFTLLSFFNQTTAQGSNEDLFTLLPPGSSSLNNIAIGVAQTSHHFQGYVSNQSGTYQVDPVTAITITSGTCYHGGFAGSGATSRIAYVDGANATTDANSSSFGATVASQATMSGFNATGDYAGKIFETYIFATAISSGDMSTQSTNAHNYWGC